jgi:uncharacterized membrane protein
VPHGDLGTYLVDLWPAYLTYAVSFLTIGIMWVNHHLLFDNFARVDRPMLLLNILLLMLPGTPLYATATLLAFVSSIASLIMFAAIALFYAFSAALFGRTDSTVARTASSGEPSS